MCSHHTLTHNAGMNKGKGSHVWPSSVVSSRSGAHTSHTFTDLSTDPVAMTQSLYLHQSAVSTCALAT